MKHRPHIAQLVCVFLEALSEFEGSSINYLSARVTDASSQATLDNLRVNAAKASPLSDAIDKLLHVRPVVTSVLLDSEYEFRSTLRRLCWLTSCQS